VKDYLLFVDTETTGVPKDWSKPYSTEGNWPYIVQIAWVIYTKDGEMVKSENHYINVEKKAISAASRRVHGITHEFLQQNGKKRETVMRILFNDLKQYQPMVIGHFMQLDYHMLGLGFYRAGFENPLKELPTFCTMKVTGKFVRYPQHKYLRLGELYQRLFNASLEKEHDALVDAKATAECFFELWKNGDIDEQTLAKQQLPDDALDTSEGWKTRSVYMLIALVVFILFYLLMSWLYE
jgi:DNA polymerase-3 subunit epsilon